MKLYDGRLFLEYTRNLANSALKYAERINHNELNYQPYGPFLGLISPCTVTK